MLPSRHALESVVRRHTGDLLQAMAAAQKVPRSVYRTLRRELRDLGATRREARRAVQAVRRQAKARSKAGPAKGERRAAAVDAIGDGLVQLVVEALVNGLAEAL